MFKSAMVGVFGFSSAVASGETADVERTAGALLDQLDELAQTGCAEEAFKRALLEKAGFMVGIAHGCEGGAPLLVAFRRGLREAAEMLRPIPALNRSESTAPMRTKTLLAALTLAVVGLCAFPTTSTAMNGSRCHGTSKPGCGSGQDALCICESKQASDATCRWVCGSLG